MVNKENICKSARLRMGFLCLACIGNYKRKKWKDNRSKATINKHLFGEFGVSVASIFGFFFL